MVDLHRQYLGIRDEVDRAIGDVIAETAFIKGPAVGLFEEELARRLEVFRSSPTSIPALSISTRRASPGWCRSVPVSSSPSICSGSRAIWLRSRPLRRSTA